METNIFKISLVLSLVAHIAFFTKLSYSNIHYLNKPIKKVEVVYQQIKTPFNQTEIQADKIDKVEKKPVKQVKTLKEESAPTSSLVKDLSKLVESFKMPQKQHPDVAKAHVKRRVVVPPLKSENMASPMYLNYYQIVRSKIERYAQTKYNKLDVGEVYLTFIISADGRLRELKLIEDRTSASQYIKKISVQSIQEADPFPPFPLDLKYPELSFNVVIYFEEAE